jgi:hypothetical protein
MRHTIFFALCMTALAAVQTAAAERPLLLAASECPEWGPNRACLRVEVIPDTRKPKLEDGGYVYEEYPTPRTLPITGKLNNGPARKYRLLVTRRQDDYSSSIPPELAYLGQSRAGHSTILTEQGPLEILSKGWTARGRGLWFYDERTWKPLDMDLIGTSSGIAVVTSPAEIGIWDAHRRLCISALLPRRERLRLLDGGCSALEGAPPASDSPGYRDYLANRIAALPFETHYWITAWFRGFRIGFTAQQIIDINTPAHSVDYPNPRGNIEPAPQPLSTIKRVFPRHVNDEMGADDSVSDHFGGAGTGIDIERIQGSHILLITIVHDDC